MITSIKNKISLLQSKIHKFSKHDNLKISVFYLIFGFFWVYISNNLIHLLVKNEYIALKITIYKGYFFMIVTACLLYLLVDKLKTTIFFTEKQLKSSYDELDSYAQQLAAYESELKSQYEQIQEDIKQINSGEEKNSAIIEALPDILFVLDYNGIFLSCETNDDNLLLIPKELFIGKSISEVMPEEVSKLSYQSLEILHNTGTLQRFEYKLTDNGVDGYFEIRMAKKGETEVLAILRDITATKKLEQELEYLSYNDPLTGLYNRRYYEDALKQLDVIDNLPLTIILGDVNGLKLINDSFGHAVGDELIKKAAKIIQTASRPQDLVIRLGGDEFVILMPKAANAQAEKLIYRINELTKFEKIHNIDISISFGYDTKYKKEDTIHNVFIKAEDYMYKKKVMQNPFIRGKAVDAVFHVLNSKHKIEKQHSLRVSELCKAIGKNLNLSSEVIHELSAAGLLHDIGKVLINDEILNKPSRLTTDEYNEIKRHSTIGYKLLNSISELSNIAEYIHFHHEMWNGNGYPNGIKGENIPLQSRIICIADAYDAMTSDRTYRKAMPKEEAIAELKKNAGIQFDPKLVNVFVEKVL